MTNLFGNKPKPQPVPSMPDPNDPLALLKQRQDIAKQASMGGGRQSTIFSMGSDYSSKTL